MRKTTLFLHHSSVIGGGSFCLLNILKVIDRTYIEPIVALCVDGPLRLEIEKLGIKVVLFSKMTAIPYNHTLYSISSLKSYSMVILSIPTFKQLLKRYKIDIVYLNNMMIYNYLKPAKEYGCKTIIHIREHWPLTEHKHQLKWAQEAVRQYADAVIAINKYSASMFASSYNKISIVYDWIDMDSRFEYRPISEILGEDATNLKVYLYTGGVQKIKGAVEILDAFSKCIKNENARLLVLGIDPNCVGTGVREKVKKVLASFGIKSYYYQVREAILQDIRIRCIPATYMLGHIMQQCYCNLSYFTIPHANLAMAECGIMGLPSIAACSEESQEYSYNGRLALLFPINSKEAFHRAISDYNADFIDLKRQLNSCNSALKEMFSKERNVVILNSVLNSIAK
ncbi:glycosyltransferase [Bacteroides timonensis]|uniref:glycosyltransferase n=1 Tax=Bacteroides timonensis TaxID=1470345 RepID=UPI0004ADC5A1|nr:glycosyltransferase [Bacteroides timonensis]